MISVAASGGGRPSVDVSARLEPYVSDEPCVTRFDLLRRSIARSTIRLAGQEPIIRLGKDREAIHDARVATRRLRSDLRTFRPLLDVAWCESLREELRWLGEILGQVRDAEVLRDRLSARIAATTDSGLAAGKVLIDELEITRLDARRRLLADLASPRYAELVERLIVGVELPITRDGEADRPAEAAGSLMIRPWRRLAKGVRRLDVVPEDAALHAVRIRVKRVRYAAEALAPAFGKRADRFAAAAKGLQETLGDHQDAVMTGKWLAEQGTGADDPSVAFAAGRLVEHEATDRDRSRTAWPKAWARLEGRKRFWT
jgi:CHAD domain-containing protein